MRLIDTHAHLFAEEFQHDLDATVAAAKSVGVQKVLLPNIDTETIDENFRLSNTYPGFFYSMMGLHPTSVDENWKTALDAIEQAFETHPVCAVGEIGIDLHWDTTFRQQQIEVFETQLQWSAERNLPVSIHSRAAIPTVVESIKRVGAHKVRGVFHSFGGNKDEMDAILSLKNFYLGINGVVTFKNAGLDKTLAQYGDLRHLVLETDAPYLAPVPYRGKRNESAYLIEIVRKIAAVFGVNEKKVAEVTTNNAFSIFDVMG